MSPSITPYKVSVPDSALTSLKSKLSASIFPAEVDFSDNWESGTPLSDVKRLAKYWHDGFDWRAQEKQINETLPQFMTKVDIDGFGELDMHFVHKKSSKAESIPLLFCHGWPGSFLEVSKILPLLTESTDGPSFHVVAPSLPNFGFSQRVSNPGFGRTQYAEAIHKVMLNLGYSKYVTQGGDWGYSITRVIASNYPTHSLAHHTNVAEITMERLTQHVASKGPFTPAEDAGVERSRWFYKHGHGYNELQSTKPSTIGFALADSPVALLAWIYEKLHDWTDSYPWTDDEILTWISVYAFSRAGPQASQRIYYEARNGPTAEKEVEQLFGYNDKGVKMGLSYFPRDLVVPPSSYGRELGDLVFEKRHESGGHFAAYERPEWLVEDLKEMFSQGAKDVVKQILG